MESEALLMGLAGIAVLGVGAQWLAWRLRLPSILLLLLAGLAVGPLAVILTGERLIDPSNLLGEALFPLVSLSVAVILFEGGLTLDLRELPRVGPVLLRLATVGVGLTWGLVTVAGHLLLGLNWGIALLLGTILTVTGPTVIGPLIRQVRPRGDVGPVANWEGIVVDVLGATLSVLVLHSLLEGAGKGSEVGGTLGLLRTLALGGLGAALGAVVLAIPLHRHWIPDALQSPVALATVLGTYSLADHWQSESGLLAVTLLGVALRNQGRVPVRHIIEFKENLRTLLISGLFVVLAAQVDLGELRQVGLAELAFLGTLILVVRPLAVLASTWRSGLSWAEGVFLAFLAPRGIVAAAISALFGAKLLQAEFAGAERLAPIVFLVIIATVTIYGLAAGPLARRLGLAEAEPQGALIVGGSRFALEVAGALSEAGLATVLVDTNRASVKEAKLAGLEAVYGSALAEDAADDLPLGGIGRLLALTPNDEVNALAALHYAELFGRSACYQLAPGGTAAKAPTSSALRGRTLFANDATFIELEGRAAAGHGVKVTPLTETFDLEAWREHHGGEALPLFRLSKEGRLAVFTAEEEPSAEPGQLLVALVPPERESGKESGREPGREPEQEPEQGYGQKGPE